LLQLALRRGVGTNPEELIAAAHAGCFSMALAAALSERGHAPSKIHTTAKVQFGPVPGSDRDHAIGQLGMTASKRMVAAQVYALPPKETGSG
jgi:organic hydroperoxide reductase OsmC/OhrA